MIKEFSCGTMKLSSTPVIANVGLAIFARSSQAPFQLVAIQANTTSDCLLNISGERPGTICWTVRFVGMSRDSGCSFIHPGPKMAFGIDFISSCERGKLYLDLFTISACSFKYSGGLGLLSFPPQVPAISIMLLTL